MKISDLKILIRISFATLAITWIPTAQGMPRWYLDQEFHTEQNIEILGESYATFYQVLEAYDEITDQSSYRDKVQVFLKKGEFQNIPKTILIRALDIALTEYLYSSSVKKCLEEVDRLSKIMGHPFPITTKEYFNLILNQNTGGSVNNRIPLFFRATSLGQDVKVAEFSQQLDGYFERSRLQLPHFGFSFSKEYLENKNLKEYFWASQTLLSLFSNLGMTWENQNSDPWEFSYAREATRCVLGNTQSINHKGAGYVW